MGDEIKVVVTRHGDRKYFEMFYLDAMTNKRVQRSTKETTRTKAIRVAAKWEQDLRAGRYKPASKVTWKEFRRRYEDEVLAGHSAKTDAMCQTVFGHIESILNPSLLRSVTADRLSHFQSKLRSKGLAVATIRSYQAHLKAALRWSVGIGLLAECPKITMPKRTKSKRMKGRPISGEEFERMLAKVEDVRGAVAAPSWDYLLRGLWLSGLRLGEALGLSWDDRDQIRVSLEGRRPMFDIPGHRHKSGEDQILPMAPEFYEFLAGTPVEERVGPVFRPESKDGKTIMASMESVSAEITRIGTAARVKVSPKKYASAHDLRRSFGTRWASRVKTPTLQQLMRHSDIETTLRYYVDMDADAMADELFVAAPKTVGTLVGTSPKQGSEEKGKKAVSGAPARSSGKLGKKDLNPQ